MFFVHSIAYGLGLLENPSLCLKIKLLLRWTFWLEERCFMDLPVKLKKKSFKGFEASCLKHFLAVEAPVCDIDLRVFDSPWENSRADELTQRFWCEIPSTCAQSAEWEVNQPIGWLRRRAASTHSLRTSIRRAQNWVSCERRWRSDYAYSSKNHHQQRRRRL